MGWERPRRIRIRAPKLGFVAECRVEGNEVWAMSMAYHCRSWHRWHSVMFSPTYFKFLLPHNLQAKRSATRRRPLARIGFCRLVLSSRSRSTASRGSTVPSLRRNWSSGVVLSSMKSQQVRKLMTRARVTSSAPAASFKASLLTHLPSGSADHKASRRKARRSPRKAVLQP